ncbi:MAG TPA: hypothetical protein VK966_05595, partial [Longimicrobiales bacterium]|nr:hypothetical protein [Longimicrobiales bacterium]
MARAEGGEQPVGEAASAPARAWQRVRAAARRHPRRTAVLAALAVALILFLWWLPDRVDTVTVEPREVVETLVATGRVRSVSRTELGASLVGTVERVLVKEGDAVAADELVIELQDSELA